MHLAVFGATGRTGRVVVAHALRRGHRVTALARDPSRIDAHPGLRAVRGDVRDPAAVAATLRGTDAVASTLGRPRRGPDICAEGIRTVLAADGPTRLVILTNYGVAESRRRSAYVALSWLLERSVLRDKERMEALLRDSAADWTLVRTPMLTDSPATGRYRAGTDLHPGLTARVSRADLAEFMLDVLGDDAYVRRSVTVTT